MKAEILTKVLSKKILEVEIKAKMKEYERLNKLILELRNDAGNIFSEINLKYGEMQELSNWLAEKEIEETF